MNESLIEKQNGNFANTVLGAVPSVVYNEDCVEGLKRFSDNHFDLAIVDPPYGLGNRLSDGGGKLKNTPMAVLYRDKDWDVLPSAEYWEQLFRVSKHQIIWGANWYGKYFGVGGICWFKDNTGNYSPCEYAYQSFNNHIHHYQYRWNGMLQQNMKDKEERIHPTQKPIALYEWTMLKFLDKGAKILDTHLGSGSSRIAADKLGFDFVGCELSEIHFNNQQKRFEIYKQQLRLW